MKVRETKEKSINKKVIKPYLSDLINNHKTPGLVRYHSSDKSWQEKLPASGKFS